MASRRCRHFPVASIKGASIAKRACKVDSSKFAAQKIAPKNSWKLDEAFYTTTATAANAVGKCQTTWRLTLTNAPYGSASVDYAQSCRRSGGHGFVPGGSPAARHTGSPKPGCRYPSPTPAARPCAQRWWRPQDSVSTVRPRPSRRVAVSERLSHTWSLRSW